MTKRITQLIIGTPTASLLVLMLIASCSKVKTPALAPEPIQLDSTLVAPISELNVPVYFPVQELENMANEKLANKIIEAHLSINQKDDSLHLSVSRFQPIVLEYDGDRGITYKLPIQIDGVVDAKVVGIKVRNKEPIRAKVIITMFSDLYLDDNWMLAPQTELKDIKWVEEPKLKVAGLNFNLKSPIENALMSNKDKIVEKLDESAKNAIKIRQAIEKLWVDIQKPIRINKKVVTVWLKAEATDIDGKLFAQAADTLMIQAKISANLYTVLDSVAAMKPVGPLPKLKRNVEKEPGLEAYGLVTLPFFVVNQVLSQATDTMHFTFQNHSVKIKSTEMYGVQDGIALRVSLQGDVKADVFLKGTLGFDSAGRKLVIENFGFDVDSEQTLISAANWLVHDEIIERIKPYLSISLENVFDILPALINKGIEKGKIGSKIDIHFTEWDLSIYQHLITKDNIQIIASIKGRADVELQKGLFNKKKKKAV